MKPWIEKLEKAPWHTLLVFASFLIILFLIQFPAFCFPFHRDAIKAVAGAAEEILANGFDPIPRTPGLDVGHPPVLTMTLAVAWGIFGESLFVSHLVQIGFACLAACYTYLLGRHLYSAKIGMLAALFLLLSPIFEAQTTNIYFDMPLAAFCIMSVYYAIRNRAWPYVVFATLASFTKIYGGIICLPILVYVLARIPKPRRPLIVLKQSVIYGVPLILLMIWVSYHRMVQGWAFIRPHVVEQFSGSLLSIWSCFNVFRTVFFLSMGQSRWILTAGMLTAVVTFIKRKRQGQGIRCVGTKPLSLSSFLFRAKETFRLIGAENLLILLVITVWVAYVAPYFIGRYLLPILPLFILIGARSLQLVLKSRVVLVSTLIVFFSWVSWIGIEPLEPLADMAVRIPKVSSLMAARGFDTNFRVMDIVLGKAGNAESDSELWDVLYVHQAAARHIETNYADLTILTDFPQNSELTVPVAGYVTNSLNVVQPWNVQSCSDFDLVYWAVPSSWRGEALSILREQCSLELVARFQSRDAFAEIYQVTR
ncbi:MAG: glycosyltransferase family 39 protein [Anaerolineae bacterium]|nr:glycosyltransferase family 39 protein [Anaerolineae bacterium]